MNTWALVLAGGEGSRLRGLTRNSNGVVVPKQFCSLRGGPSLLQEALNRAATIAPTERVCSVVAEQHRRWWTPILNSLPEDNVIVQPQNRGTAYGILLPLLRIAERDPDATVVMLPADHYLRDEEIMSESLRQAAELAADDAESIYLLGIEPEEPDTELGYILPVRRAQANPAAVLRFIEKPSESQARTLVDQGALWNAFIMAGSVRALLSLFDRAFAPAMAALRDKAGVDIGNLYEGLRSVDFSRDVLPGRESMLKVLPVPPCGWSDLGTPKRIGVTLRRLQDQGIQRIVAGSVAAFVNLADAYGGLMARAPAPRADLRA